MARDWREVFDLGDTHEVSLPAEAAPDEPDERRGVSPRLRKSLSTSRRALQAELSASVFEKLDSETWERLEEALILADVGAPATADVVGKLEQEVEAGDVTGPDAVRSRLIELLGEIAGGDGRIDLKARPAVIMV